MDQVFVSYADADYPRAAPIAEGLTRAGVPVWTDSAILSGEDWVTAIDRGLEDSRIFLLLVTPTFLQSDVVMYELGAALSKHRDGSATVIPVVLEGPADAGLPAYLRRFQLIDGRNLDAERIAAQVLERLQAGDDTAPVRAPVAAS